MEKGCNNQEIISIEKKFIDALAQSLLSEIPPSDEMLTPDEVYKIFSMAFKHRVLPMIYESVCRRVPCPTVTGDGNGIGNQTETKTENEEDLKFSRYMALIKRTVMDQVMVQTMTTKEFIRLWDHLEKNGIHPIAVKGIICRSLFPRPDHRSSSDEDILVVPSEFDACRRALLEAGLKEEVGDDEVAQKNVIPYSKPGSGLHIELHRYLFSPNSEAYSEFNRFFDAESMIERSEKVDVGNGSVTAPCPTDHLLYLICHSFKHFMHSGFGLRQVCDIVLFAREYGERIDWDYVLRCCREIRAHVFAAEIFRVGRLYLGVDVSESGYPDEWKALETDEVPFLNDMLDSGIYGHGESEARIHSSNITLGAVKDHRKGKNVKKNALQNSIFLSVAEMIPKYPYLKRHRWLLPYAWCSRVVTYMIRRKGSGRTRAGASETLRIGRDRVELMRNYGIID